MQGYVPGKAADHYLIQRIQGASSEQLAALLLEGGQRFINLTLQAMQNKDLINQGRYVNRTSDIILGLRERLNHEAGGELVENLIRIYDWWIDELFEGAMKNEPERLRRISHHMGELRSAWEELHQRKIQNNPAPSPSATLGDVSA